MQQTVCGCCWHHCICIMQAYVHVAFFMVSLLRWGYAHDSLGATYCRKEHGNLPMCSSTSFICDYSSFLLKLFLPHICYLDCFPSLTVVHFHKPVDTKKVCTPLANSYIWWFHLSEHDSAKEICHILSLEICKTSAYLAGYWWLVFLIIFQPKISYWIHTNQLFTIEIMILCWFFLRNSW